jgi:hypothetical protein
MEKFRVSIIFSWIAEEKVHLHNCKINEKKLQYKIKSPFCDTGTNKQYIINKEKLSLCLTN